MRFNTSLILIKLLVIQYLSVLCVSQDFDFFYFVQQWPGAYCDTKHTCCYPNVFDKSEISELMSNLEKNWPSLSCPSSNGFRFWSHEWEKHGTCSESELDQKDYFEAALKLKQKVNLLQILKTAGIVPDDGMYSLESIKEAIKEGAGYTPGIECNKDSAGNSQLYQVYLCVDTSGQDIIECPVLPKGRCASDVQFAKF
ncbi:ribonuclease 3-like [Prunus yedoensis var. nudiflora]|uniref:Ribonuclease 3-like n=1 Tax=Prunus yedoensis var. nudiflora TaxID=2094558 RepID=A0A314UZ15_PRUYE|nr:ribonuclease 3-like [Prunus yedoensis var. nudiflora]